jgi:hypothetical protein
MGSYLSSWLGAFVWAKAFGGALDDFSTALAADLTLGVIIGGYYKSSSLIFQSGSSIGNTGNTNLEEAFVAR